MAAHLVVAAVPVVAMTLVLSAVSVEWIAATATVGLAHRACGRTCSGADWVPRSASSVPVAAAARTAAGRRGSV